MLAYRCERRPGSWFAGYSNPVCRRLSYSLSNSTSWERVQAKSSCKALVWVTWRGADRSGPATKFWGVVARLRTVDEDVGVVSHSQAPDHLVDEDQAFDRRLLLGTAESAGRDASVIALFGPLPVQ